MVLATHYSKTTQYNCQSDEYGTLAGQYIQEESGYKKTLKAFTPILFMLQTLQCIVAHK